MSNANIKLLQDAFDAFKRGDIQAVIDALTEDVTWGLAGRSEDVPFLGIRHGKAGALEFFRVLGEVQTVTAFEPKRYAATEDMVFGWGRTEWTMVGNGVSGDNDWLFTATVRGGKISAFRGYLDTAAMTEAYRAPTVKKVANG